MMKSSEADLMKGIDDKFQKLLSQFEMNMNILELKSKRQQFLIEQSKEDDYDKMEIDMEPSREDSGNLTEPKRTQTDVKNMETTEYKSEPRNRKEVESLIRESMPIARELNPTLEKNKTNFSYDKSGLEKENVSFMQEDPDIGTTESMGSVLKYISECAEMKNKKYKKKKRNISFSQNEANFLDFSDDDKSHSTQNMTGNKNKKLRKKSSYISDDISGTSSNKISNKSNNELVRKCSKTVTNISKRGKKRNVKNARNINSKDWISYNRNNVTKLQKKTKPSKIALLKKDDNKLARKNTNKSNIKISIEPEPEQESKVKSTIEHFETVENKLINDFLKNDFSELLNSKTKNNDTVQKNLRDKKFFKSTKPIKALFESNTTTNFDKSKRIDENENPKNITVKGNERKNDTKKALGDAKRTMEKKTTFNNLKNQKFEKKINRIDDGKSIISNIESKAQSEMYPELKGNNFELEINKAKSEIKIGNKYMSGIKKVEEKGDLEDVKVELDEFFSEIPFVVGRSISRTYNLGLSFQHAMSLLRRLHSKREVKEVLSIGRIESEAGTESFHCLGMAHCEAMGHSDWTKDDEEAWEENPWDPELNRRRPKCTCLPNNCTTLKNVLKQLTIKNPGFQMRTLQPSFSSISNNKDFEVDVRKPDLKRAQSQTRTELLRNIRNIQIQLTPSSEILK